MFSYTYHGDHTARPDAVPHSHHAHVVSVLAPPHEVLVSHVVGAVVDHEAAALHPAGVAPAQVGGKLRTVTAGLIVTTLEVPVLVEDDLKEQQCFLLPFLMRSKKPLELFIQLIKDVYVFKISLDFFFRWIIPSTYPAHGHGFLVVTLD